MSHRQILRGNHEEMYRGNNKEVNIESSMVNLNIKLEETDTIIEAEMKIISAFTGTVAGVCILMRTAFMLTKNLLTAFIKTDVTKRIYADFSMLTIF